MKTNSGRTPDLTYSFIIPVYNRPEEIEELLQSMIQLEFDRPYEIVIVEDGSLMDSSQVVDAYQGQLNINYVQKKNTGPGDSRNYGMQIAKGNYFLILDSDVILPPNYLTAIDDFLQEEVFHCIGGPDAAHASFSDLQKAISYSMTSFWTTGGIRGNKTAVGRFQPRSFNMGLSKEAFEVSGGFGDIHPGEDPDLAIRLWKLGYQTALVPDALVYHKRRISFQKFYQQVSKFGTVRPILNQWHPETAKVTYWFPTLFIGYTIVSIIFLLSGNPYLISLLFLYLLGLGIDSGIKNRSVTIGVLSICAVMVQFYGYGVSFLKSYFLIHVLQKNPKRQFEHLFFQNS